MKATELNKYEYLLSSLQHFHSIVGIAFPMAVTKIGKNISQTFAADQEGSRIFIPSKLFLECEKVALDVQAALEKLNPDDLKNQVQSCWTELSDLLRRIKKAGRQGSISQINEAFVLLCLSSGLIQHFICSKEGITPPQTQQFSKVEPIEKLLELCGRSDLKNEPVEKMLGSVVGECRSVLRTNL
jgi:hypothetical protein